MNNSRRPLVSRIAVALFLASALAMFGVPNTAAAADNSAALRTISVSGEGEASGKPDQGRLSAGVVTQAPTAAAALSANTSAMNRVFAALKTLGIPDNKIQTSNFSVQPQYPPYRPDAAEPRNIVGYQVSNQVSVTVDDLAKSDPALDALVKSGANPLGGVSFAIADPKPLAERARAAAVGCAAAIKNARGRPRRDVRPAAFDPGKGTSFRPGPVFALRAGSGSPSAARCHRRGKRHRQCDDDLRDPVNEGLPFQRLDLIHDAVHARDQRLIGRGRRQVDAARL
jgi:uncharacterized protein YggE